jgi:hypothetical protein
MSIPVFLRPSNADHRRILDLSLRGLAACGAVALLFFAGWSLSAGKPNQARMIASVCMDEAHAYFEAARRDEELGFESDALDDAADGAGARLIRCLHETLSFSEPLQ